MADWFVKKCNLDIERMCTALGIHKPLAYALGARGVRTGGDVHKLLDGGKFEDIKNLKDVVKSFDILKAAIAGKVPMCIYGDYDVDGVTSTTILYKSLKALGAEVEYFIPNRIEDGYGLSADAVRKLAEKGIKLLVTCDNGIAAPEEIALAKELGMRVIVYDHHEPKKDDNGNEILPEADALVDAKIKDCGYKFRYMCAGALCYRIMKEFYLYMGKNYDIDDEMLSFAGIATLCDVVELVGENKWIAAEAMKILNQKVDNLGLQALIEKKSLQGIEEYHIGFVIGPCINASGRLDSATIAVKLFVTDDSFEAEELAEKLISFNDERKLLTEAGTETVMEKIEGSELINDRVLVVFEDEIHESIAGIIAGRVKEKYNRPAIVLTRAENGVKGSARSIEEYNMFKELSKCSALLDKFGGHTMAAGLSLQEDKIDALRCVLNDNCTLTEKDLSRKINVDGIIELADVNLYAADELEMLRPFGPKNEKPVYATLGVFTRNIYFLGQDKRIVSMVLEDSMNNSIKAIMFKGKEDIIEMIEEKGFSEAEAYKANLCLDIVYNIDINFYNGNRSVQLKIKDFRKSRV